jgi:hypothetical protein
MLYGKCRGGDNVMRAMVTLCLIVFFCFLCSSRGAGAAGTIRVVAASYGSQSLSSNVTEQMREKCEGKMVCEGLLVNMFPDNAFGQVKTLKVSYSCDKKAAMAEIQDGLFWRISCPPCAQPSYRVDFHIVKDKTCDREDEPPEVLKLPNEYRYCWHKKIDYKTVHSSSNASLTYNSKGDPDGISISWKTSPDCSGLLTAGRASIDHLWTVVGALPGENCPPQ